MLTDAVDGTLPSGDAIAFYAHKEDCAACAQLLEEAQRGAEWLRFLAPEPEAPAGLAERILLHTTGPEATTGSGGNFPMLAPAGPGMPAVQPWFGPSRFGGSLSLLYRHPAESRLLMTVAMAFFSIAFTLNLAGVRLKEIHLRDLKPTVLATNISRGYYIASAQVTRYYENLRFVYELESRVNEMRRSVGSSSPEESGGRKQPSGDAAPAAGNKTGHAPGGGAAQEPSPKATSPRSQRQQGSPAASGKASAEPAAVIPVMLCPHPDSPSIPPSRASSLLEDDARAHAPLTCTRDQAERSLA